MGIQNLAIRIRALAARVPTNKRTPKLCVVTSGDSTDIREARIAEAERVGDPILEVEFFEAVAS